MASLHILMKRAYVEFLTENGDEQRAKPLEEWRTKMSNDYPQFFYWWTVLQMEVLVCQFIKSIRRGNFDLYKESLVVMMPWVFALDHVNYSRWLPIHISDMLKLNSLHPGIYQAFQNGHFVVQRSKHRFSSIGLDHNHEQLNKDIKGDSGVKGLFNNPDSLRKWMIAGPEIARLVREFEKDLKEDGFEHLHHEESFSHQKEFLKDVSNLVEHFEKNNNPFKDRSDNLTRLITMDIMPTNSVTTMKKVYSTGQTQYEHFCKERIHGNKPITDRIPKNNFIIFKSLKSKNTKSSTQVKGLRKDCSLFSRLYISSQVREGDLKSFFAHENQPVPPSLSNMGDLRKGKKSDLVDCLEAELTGDTLDSTFTAKVLDGAAIVNIISPRESSTFEEYAEQDFLPYLRYDPTIKSLFYLFWS